MCIYGCIFLVLCGFLIITRGEKVEDSCKRVERPFVRAGSWFCRKAGIEGRWIRGREAGYFLAAVWLGSFLGFFAAAGESRGEIKTLERREQDYEETLEARVGGEVFEIPLQVSAQVYEPGKIEEYLEEAEERLDRDILKGNTSLSQVTGDLYLPEQVEGLPVTVSWYTDHPEILDWTGRVERSEQKQQVLLQAELICQEEKRQKTWEVTVLPAEKAEGIDGRLKEEAEKGQENKTGNTLLLPESYEGQKVEWRRPEEGTAVAVFGIAVLLGILLMASGLQERKKEQEMRERQMMADYPEIVNQLALLLSAGLSARRAFARLSADYQMRRKRGAKARYAYDALTLCCREMEQGVPEAAAYEHLGGSCPLAAYKTLATLLVQNLRKGNRHLLELLEQESAQAFDDRKRQAKILGEEAGTKLLFPMILLLGIIFVIILVPAWMSFGL